MLAAIERGKPGQAYNIADDSQLGFGGMVAGSFGLRPPMTVPLWMTAVMPYARRAVTCSLRLSSDRAHAELGWQPTFRTVADGLRALAAPRSAQAANAPGGPGRQPA
ncbi:hypothetical protein ACL02O_14260 [Micromonospora sp. MS34]|uniref:hypothetical protein n=1 Tax=Micromonospora sp. MS34 TaxID=3385971 RepID=UPI0039A35FEF